MGGADNIQIEQIFPSSQKTLVYNFGTDVSNWTFYLDFQTVVADTVTYDRNTGEPNFANSSIIGYFQEGIIDVNDYVNVLDAGAGQVAITFPSNLYGGSILPDARTHNPITIVGVTWTIGSTPTQTSTHRFAFIQCWEPGVNPGDPVLDEGYVPILIGA